MRKTLLFTLVTAALCVSSAPTFAASKAEHEAAFAVQHRLGPRAFIHDVVEHRSQKGAAVCGYYAQIGDREGGGVFVFNDNKLLLESDFEYGLFRRLVERACPEFVLRPYLRPVAERSISEASMTATNMINLAK